MKIIRLLIFLPLAILLTSCEYQLSEEFYNDIEKPADTHEAQLTLSMDQDSILIYQDTEISYSLNTFGLKCNGIMITYLNDTIKDFNGESGKFLMTPEFFKKDWFDLKISFYMGTGSGSIADKLNAENYIGSKTWKVCFVDLDQYNFKQQSSINKDGFLELFWVKPSFIKTLQGAINPYYTIRPQISRISGDTTFYTDSLYAGGKTSYTLYIYPRQYVSIQREITANYPLPELKATRIGLDTVELTWANTSLKTYFKIYGDHGWQKYFYTGYGKTIRTTVTPGVLNNFYLEIYPYNFAANKYNYSTVKTSIFFGDSANYKFHYSYVKDKFYIPGTSDINRLEQIDITKPSGNAYADEGIYKLYLWGNQKGTRFASYYSGDIHVFNEQLIETEKINISASNENYGGQMTTNDCFGFYNYNKQLYTVVNLAENRSWDKFTFKPFADDENYWGNYYMSLDGNYFTWLGNKYLTIYDISDHISAKKVYQCPSTDMYYTLANPQDFKQVIISKTDKIELRSVPEFNLISQIDFPGHGIITPVNIDTYSKNLLTFSKNQFHVIRLSDMKELLKFGGGANPSSAGSARLSRNIFFFNQTKTDLTTYLNQ